MRHLCRQSGRRSWRRSWRNRRGVDSYSALVYYLCTPFLIAHALGYTLSWALYLSVLLFILWATVIYSSRPRCDVKTSTVHNFRRLTSPIKTDVNRILQPAGLGRGQKRANMGKKGPEKCE